MTSTSPNPQTSSRKNGSAPLIRLDAVTKVFLTDEVETHALSGIHLDIRDGNIFRSPDRRAAESRRYCRSWVCSTRLRTAVTRLKAAKSLIFRSPTAPGSETARSVLFSKASI